MAISARADGPNLVQNGSFESNGGPGELGNGITSAANWSTIGYSFLFTSATSGTGVSSSYGPNDVAIYGSNGSLAGVPASPDGGYFVGADGNFPSPCPSCTAPITQTLTGLTTGQTYQVGFYWAASQQQGFSGDTQQQWQVSLGSQTLDTPIYYLPSQDFSGWMYQTLDFTATGTSEVLSFLAWGNNPVPPMLLLDGVTANEVTPEPGSLSLTLTGVGVMGALLLLGSKKLVFRR
jgi:hypothetical protein